MWLRVLLVVIVPALPAVAQSLPDSPPREAAIPVGPALVYPFFTSSLEQSDNVFQRSDTDPNKSGATVTTIIPGFVFLLPFSHSEASLGYAVRYRDYAMDDGSDGQIDPFTHYVRGGVRLVFGSGVVTELRQELRRGVVDTQTVEGGEVVFTGERQDHDATELLLALERGQRRYYLGGGSTKDEIVGERRSSIFDVDEQRLRLGAEFPLRSTVDGLWEVRGHRADLDNTQIQRTEEQAEGRVGARWRAGRLSEFDLSVGWIWSRYGLAGEQDLSLPFGSAGYQRRLGAGAQFSARVERNVYPSVEAENPSYVSDQLVATVSNSQQARIGYGLRAAYYRNDYREASRGLDRTVAGESWIGYRLGRWMQARGSVYFGTRNSTLPQLDYSARSVGFSLIAGPY